MSSNETFRRPSFRSCLLGLVIYLILSAVILYTWMAFPYLVNFFATPFMLVPDALGMVDKVSSEDVIAVTVPSEHEFKLPKAGEYFIFSTNLLPAKNRILVKPQETSIPLEVPFIVSGVNPYGSSIVEGVPIGEFQANRAGTYELYLQDLPPNAEPEYTLFIVPDTSARNQKILAISLFLHVGIIGLAARQIYLWRNKDRIQQEKMEKSKKREKFDEWVRKQRQGQ